MRSQTRLWFSTTIRSTGNAGAAITATPPMEACQKRDISTGELFARGYCIVGNFGYQQRWERGPAARWTRRGEKAACHG
jgi:hypothetical protein